MINKIIGGILLIIGTSIGGGLLALPMATAGGGFVNSIGLFIAAWLMMTFGAFFILEVNLRLPEHTNMVSMAKATLGNTGRIITWIIYLLLLYALLSAYIAGGSDLVAQLSTPLHLTLPAWLGGVIFTAVFGAIVHCGIRTVDGVNRLLMAVKIGAYLLLVVLVVPHIQLARLGQGQARLLSSALMVVVTSFGYATIIPSLRTYFNSNVNALRLAIGVGSAIPLIFYLVWDFAVQGSVERSQLMQMAGSARAVSDLTTAVSANGSNIVSSTAHLFTVICVATSFLGVSLCLWDFLADGLKIHKETAGGRWRVTLATLLPPLLIVLFWPNIFVKALAYAGVLCVLLLMLMPGLMAWSDRYIQKSVGGYRVWGGRGVLAAEIILSALLAVYGMAEVL
jgi:tyrosine-specific transport protein